MPERITEVSLQAFRGVPDTFTLQLPSGHSCVILGSNATGKSSIADAIEWYFRGRIEFLSREGRPGAIRHSGASDRLETQVTISTDGSLGGSISMSTPSRRSVQDVGRLELFLLRGRTLADFVDKTKGQKWEAIAELLGLEAIDQLRLDLQHARNTLETQAASSARDLASKQAALGRRVPEVSEQGVLEAIKEKCETVSIPPPNSLDEALSPEWLQGAVPERSQEQQAAALQVALSELRSVSEPPTEPTPVTTWNQVVTEGKQDQLSLALFQGPTRLSVQAIRMLSTARSAVRPWMQKP